MAEMLVMAQDSHGVGDAKYMKGDVVYVAGDGHDWSETEKKSEMFIILKVPTVTKATYDGMLEHEWDGDTLKRRRTKKIKDATVDAGAATLTKAQATAAIETKAAVIGP